MCTSITTNTHSSEDTPDSEDPNNHNPPDIEKYQPYAGHAHLDDDDNDDDDDDDDDDWETLSGTTSPRDRRSVVVLCAACYVAFAILSFFSAAYYFWCLMPCTYLFSLLFLNFSSSSSLLFSS
ncbi:hypothetical protein BO78DRAFT_394395 [Aspergillus sclerotiicarbonarius CBS 121057]|uniref:Uncharacterized protein n=1 Tax=Aspergillus sclerotiicarbonarius (strain CBS 121057 / IBT 28362) TaxID=1448318 RepID=A0A319EIY8_ASPSB|nr:hypothetical protein BO78DRAFT_394395 [Aspergillus sclerotiicarbonarius CBS 121057]